MNLVFICLTLAAVLGGLGFFGTFGETDLQTEYVLIALLCTASGLQNSAVSVASGHTVRTTHMTGNTTDLGIGIVRVWSLKKHTASYDDEVRAAGLRGGIITAFSLGAAVSGALFMRLHYVGFLFPAAIALYTLIWEDYFNRRNPDKGVSTLVFIPKFLKK
jgi:uncharacterized membrane protein YoaK (UPF0700 family)